MQVKTRTHKEKMKHKNNKGQSTLEFIMTFSAAIGFILLFLKMAMNYTEGYMVHHAVFMASRSYLVADSEAGGQSPESRDKVAFDLAKKVFDKNLPTGLIPGFDGVLKENNATVIKFPAFVGVFVEFTEMFSIGLIGGRDRIKLRSESFLGREPSRVESRFQTCQAIKYVVGNSCNVHATLDDNGE